VKDRKMDRHRNIEIVCESCGVIFLRYACRPNRGKKICKKCHAALARIVQGPQDGSHNICWRGGLWHWQSGKMGRDKDGLSWKVQRRLAWERDKFTCQKCGDSSKKPHCHHKVPYRLSKSHSLDNLVCLCSSCHKKIENQFVEGC
jgi:hypothetical protein